MVPPMAGSEISSGDERLMLPLDLFDQVGLERMLPNGENGYRIEAQDRRFGRCERSSSRSQGRDECEMRQSHWRAGAAA